MKLIIDRKTWLRGEGSQDSYLLRATDGKKCCLGFAGEQCGIPLDKLRGKPYFSRKAFDGSLPPDFPSALSFLVNADGHYSGAAERLMLANDVPLNGSYESEREDFLTKEFKKYGIEVEFIN